MLAIFKGDTNKAAGEAVRRGWKALQEGQADKALRRFNQAWLIDPRRGDIYWGLAVATGVRGDSIKTVEVLFAKAERIIGANSSLQSDWGRVLDQRKMPKSAIPHFLKAIRLNPKNLEPHIGMIRASNQLGDKAIAEKHMKIYQSLKQ